MAELEQDLHSKVSDLQRLKSEKSRLEEMHDRRTTELQTELSHLKAINSELRSKNNIESVGVKYKQHIQSLEAKFKEIRDNTALMSQKIDQVTFEKEQCLQTVSSLKQELTEAQISLEEIRREKHTLELQQIEEKDRYSDLFVKSSSQQEDLNKARHEVDF